MKYEGVTKLDSVLSKNSTTEIKNSDDKKIKKKKRIKQEGKKLKMNKNFLKTFVIDCAICLFVLGGVFTFVNLDTEFTNTVSGSIQNAIGQSNEEIQNSVEDVYKTELVSNLLGATFTSAQDSFILPVTSANVQMEEGIIKLSGEENMCITSACAGTVMQVDYIDGVKRITIEHESGIVSSYKGLKNVGVTAGDKVASGQVLGISGNNLEFCLMEEGEIVKSVALDGTNVYIIEN